MFHARLDDLTELRLAEEEDADIAFSLVERDRDHLREYLQWVEGCRSIVDMLALIQYARAQVEVLNGFTCSIWHEGRFAGAVGLNSVNWQFRCAEIGYWLGEEFQGKGIVTRACRALLNHVFNEMWLAKAEIHVGVTNTRSRAIPERLGFVEEGTLRLKAYHNGETEDLVVYGILADEWRALSHRSHE